MLAVDAAAGADVSAQAVGVKLAHALRAVAGLDEGQVRNGLVALADAKFAVPNKLPRRPEVDDGRDAERAHRAARCKLARTFVCRVMEAARLESQKLSLASAQLFAYAESVLPAVLPPNGFGEYDGGAAAGAGACVVCCSGIGGATGVGPPLAVAGCSCAALLCCKCILTWKRLENAHNSAARCPMCKEVRQCTKRTGSPRLPSSFLPAAPNPCRR